MKAQICLLVALLIPLYGHTTTDYKSSSAATTPLIHDRTITFTGTARLLNKPGSPIYTENHHVVLGRTDLPVYKEVKSTYSSPDGTIFAELKSNFERSPTVPEIDFHDQRFNYREFTKFETSDKLIIERTKQNAKKSTKIKVERNHLLGQAFHNFIVLNFEQLANEKTSKNTQLDFKFILPSLLTDYRFSITVDSFDDLTITFMTKPSSLFLAVLADPIRVTYDRKTKKLLRYQGLSNLDSPEGSSQLVDIQYKYLESEDLFSAR